MQPTWAQEVWISTELVEGKLQMKVFFLYLPKREGDFSFT